MEITAYFGKDNVLIVNGDDDFLGALCDTEYRLVKVGAAGGSQVYVYNISDSAENGVEFTLEYKEKATRIHLPVPGRHNAVNAALAIAAGLEAGVSVEEAAKGLQSLEFTDKRLSVNQGYRRYLQCQPCFDESCHRRAYVGKGTSQGGNPRRYV